MSLDLPSLTKSTPAQKPWLNVVANTILCNILTATNFIVQSISAQYLTLVQQVSAPNPAVGSKTLFVSSSTGALSTQDSLGNTVAYIPSTGGTMTGPLGLSATRINVGNSGNLCVNDQASGSSSVLISFYSSSSNGPNQIVIGTGNSGGSGQYILALGNGITNTGSINQVTLGGGNTGITNGQDNSVVIGNDITVAGGGGNSAICIGDSAGIGPVPAAISIGAGAVNNTSNSFLFGDAAISNIRPNSAGTCTLGTPSNNFSCAFLRDAAIASGVVFSQWDTVTLTNSAGHVILNDGKEAYGTTHISAGASLGTIYRFKAIFSMSVSTTGFITIDIGTNGNPLVAIGPILGGTAFSDIPGIITGEIMVGASGNAICSVNFDLGLPPSTGSVLTSRQANATSVYDPTVLNILYIGAQWNEVSVGDVFVCKSLYLETLAAE